MAIISVDGKHRGNFSVLIDEMYRLRKRTFADRMGWDVSIIGEWEVDGFDAIDPLYVLSIHEERVVGCFRLLPTTSFNMLNNVFSQLLPDGKPICDPRIWESSRFCVDRKVGSSKRILCELGLAMHKIGRANNLTHIATVYDNSMHTLLQRIGCEGEPLGEPKTIGHTLTWAVKFEIGGDTEERLKYHFGDSLNFLEGSKRA